MKKLIVLVLFLVTNTQVYGETYLVEDVEFISNQTTLSGSIVFPKRGEIHAAVVFVHGSGEQTRNMHWAERFASQGIAALVYDKRGVGQSGGNYESDQSVSGKNIDLLADDARAAFDILLKHSKLKEVSVGLTGVSQAGWIVPLAAEKSREVDFMVLWSSPVCKVSEEDIFSKYTADLDLKKVPSYDEALSSRKRKYIWPDFLGRDSDPIDSLAKLAIPGFWIFGQNDGSVPIDLSIERLQQQIDSGKNFEYALFSSLGHDNMSETFLTATQWVNRLPKR